jgi:type IV pilus assembly protein PilA
MRLAKKSFTLLELIIVMATIVLLAAIAIPQMLRARFNANYASALSACQSLCTALQNFCAANPPVGFPPNLSALAPAGQPSYIHPALAVAGVPARQGYSFFYTQIPGPGSNPSTQFHIYSAPTVMNITGVRGFYVDEQGTLCAINPAAGDPGHAPAGSVCPPGYNVVTN